MHIIHKRFGVSFRAVVIIEITGCVTTNNKKSKYENQSVWPSKTGFMRTQGGIYFLCVKGSDQEQQKLDKKKNTELDLESCAKEWDKYFCVVIYSASRRKTFNHFTFNCSLRWLASALLELTHSRSWFSPHPRSANQVIDPECPTSCGITTFPRRKSNRVTPSWPITNRTLASIKG